MTGPRIRFVVGGVQKAGTSALAGYLRSNPALALPAEKEAHVFDAPGFDDAWSVAEIDARYTRHFPPHANDRIAGDATPIYLFLPQAVERIRRYNAAMRWIVLLRDPVDRALSQYHMERNRGRERWPPWAAMLLERWRLRGSEADLSDDSPIRVHGYRARSDYAAQLDRLYAHFPPSQVLLLRTRELRDDPAGTLARAWAFLGVPAPSPAPSPEEVFVGDYPRDGVGTRRMVRWLLRREIAALRDRHGITFDP